MKENTLSKAYKWILFGILFISILSPFMHFIYEWSNKLIVFGIIAPVNESIWEHLKLAFGPTLLWWGIGYLVIKKQEVIDRNRWFSSMTISIIICSLIIVSFYYTYTGALGIESIVLDVISLFIGIAGGTWIALHCYKYAKFKSVSRYSLMVILFMMIGALTIFTFNPPKLPIFKDGPTGTYGINRTM